MLLILHSLELTFSDQFLFSPSQKLREVGQASHEWPLDSALFLNHVLNRIKTMKEQDTLRHHSLHLAFREPYPTIPVSQRRQLHDNRTEISLTLSNMQRPKHLLHSPPHLLSHLNYHPKCSIHKKHRTRLNPRLLYASCPLFSITLVLYPRLTILCYAIRARWTAFWREIKLRSRTDFLSPPSSSGS